MKNRKAAVIKGDGTGPELIDSFMKILETVNHNIEVIYCDAGEEWWKANGGNSLIPEKTWDTLKSSDVCLKGPTTTPPDSGSPRSVAVSIRQEFDLYANIRPIKTFPRKKSFCDKIIGNKKPELDFICVREATEGLYTGHEFNLGDKGDVYIISSGVTKHLEFPTTTAINIRKITKSSVERIAKYAFNLAKQNNWNKVYSVSKGNILKESDGLYNETVREVSRFYPEITLDEYFVDNIAQQLVKNPERFNNSILLSTNLFMDIISEEASGHIGNIGLIYSANFGDSYAMFEPAHGSAPKYKGLDKVNPTATILSGAWMLEYLGEKKASDKIFKAVKEIIKEGKNVTYDLKGKASTSEMTKAVVENMKTI